MHPEEHDTSEIPRVVAAPVLPVLVTEKPTIAKAIVATTGAMTAAIISALADGHVDTWEIILGLLTAIGAGAATWAVSNKRS